MNAPLINLHMLGPFIREKIRRGLHKTRKEPFIRLRLHKTRTAGKNGSRLTSRLDRSNDEVNCFGASF